MAGSLMDVFEWIRDTETPAGIWLIRYPRREEWEPDYSLYGYSRGANCIIDQVLEDCVILKCELVGAVIIPYHAILRISLGKR